MTLRGRLTGSTLIRLYGAKQTVRHMRLFSGDGTVRL